MTRHSLFRLLMLLLLLPLALSACNWFGDEDKPDAGKNGKAEASDKKDDKTEAKSKIPTPDPICPQVAVVRGLDLLRDYGRETPSPGQLVAAVRLTGVEGDCAYIKNDKQGIDIGFSLDMAAERGPRLGGGYYTAPVFIAVLDPDDTVLNKNQMSIELNLSGDDPVVNHAEPLHVFIPLPKAQQNMGPHYKVLAGFQLNDAEADYAKKALQPR